MVPPDSVFPPVGFCVVVPFDELLLEVFDPPGESFSMFAAMLESLKYEVISTLSKVQVRMPEEVEELEQQRRMEAERLAQMQQLSHQDDDSAAAAALAAQTGERKVGRNDPCPCGSGKKYKQCHGRLQ